MLIANFIGTCFLYTKTNQNENLFLKQSMLFYHFQPYKLESNQVEYGIL